MIKSAVINLGIIGPGRVAERHANAINQIPNARLWSIAGRELTQATEFATHHNAHAPQNAFTDIPAMLSDPELDAVIIATPDKLHLHHSLLAIQANKSLLVEKPLCTTHEEGQQIIKALKHFQKTVAVGYHLRWHDGLRQIATKCHNGEFENPRHIRLHWGVDFFTNNKWRTDPQYSQWLCLTVLGTHLIDIMRWIMTPACGEIIRTESLISNSYQELFDETVMASFEFESGATAQIFCSVTLDAPFKLELYTDNSVIIGDALTSDRRSILINQCPLPFKKNNPYLDQLKDFLRILSENSKPEVNINEGLKNIDQLLALSSQNQLSRRTIL